MRAAVPFYYNEFAGRVANRFEVSYEFRHSTVGLRVCATWPLTRSKMSAGG